MASHGQAQIIWIWAQTCAKFKVFLQSTMYNLLPQHIAQTFSGNSNLSAIDSKQDAYLLNVFIPKDLEIKVDLGSKWIIWLLACMWIYEATYYEGISDWALNVTQYKHSCSTSTRTLPSQIRCHFSEYNAWRLMKDWPNVHNCTGCTSHHHLGS